MNSPTGDFLCPPGFAGPRGLRALSREGSTLVEAARYARRMRTDRRERATFSYAGHHRRQAVDPVLLIPGFIAGDGTLSLMAAFLRQQGFRTYRAGIRSNVGCTQAAAERLERRLESIVIRRGRKVSIVGHSLGGLLARGLAVRRPDLVEGIITMGSPLLAPGAIHQVLAWDIEMLTRLTRAGFGGLMSEDCVAGECARSSWTENRSALPEGVAFTAIYSKRDAIVDWRACIDPLATAVEVSTSHCGMAIDPQVLDVVLSTLRDQQVSRASRQAAPSELADWRRAAGT